MVMSFQDGVIKEGTHIIVPPPLGGDGRQVAVIPRREKVMHEEDVRASARTPLITFYDPWDAKRVR